MAEAPAIRVMLICECAVGCLVAPEPAARFRPAADSSSAVAGRSVELPAPGAGSPKASTSSPAARGTMAPPLILPLLL
eukprot:15483680-Alexandrium_andersonii.AAC.1